MIETTQGHLSLLERAKFQRLPASFNPDGGGHGVNRWFVVVTTPILWFGVWISFQVAPHFGTGAWAWLVGMAVIGVTLALVAFVQFLFAQRREATRQKELRVIADRGRYALFFRPFSFDQTTTSFTFNAPMGQFIAYEKKATLEEELAAICLRCGLGLRAIGRPVDAAGPIMQTTTDDDWKKTALQMLAEAYVVIVVPGYSDGSFWELQQLSEGGLLEKTVWMMPPSSFADEARVLRDRWAATKTRCEIELGLPLPEYDRAGGLFAFFRGEADEFKADKQPFSYPLLAKAILATKGQAASSTVLGF